MLFYGSIISFISGILLLMSFASPYWLQSWGGTESPFENMGLWEFCFHNFRHPDYQYDTLFDGCHWVWGNEYRYIREKLLPGKNINLPNDTRSSYFLLHQFYNGSDGLIIYFYNHRMVDSCSVFRYSCTHGILRGAMYPCCLIITMAFRYHIAFRGLVLWNGSGVECVHR